MNLIVTRTPNFRVLSAEKLPNSNRVRCVTQKDNNAPDTIEFDLVDAATRAVFDAYQKIMRGEDFTLTLKTNMDGGSIVEWDTPTFPYPPAYTRLPAPDQPTGRE
jgi:hypothetical protein